MSDHKSKLRIAQQKREGDKSIYLTLPVKETGIYPGDGVLYDVVESGKVILTKMKKEDIEKENSIICYINKLLQAFGLHTDYELKKKVNDSYIGE